MKIVFLLCLVAISALAEDENFEGLEDAEDLLACNANGKMIRGQKTCILKCTIGCTSVGCGLFKQCVKGDSSDMYKCVCNFGQTKQLSNDH